MVMTLLSILKILKMLKVKEKRSFIFLMMVI